jgi:1-acyl-sn-glycerol-3-phosphate acyltransferase
LLLKIARVSISLEGEENLPVYPNSPAIFVMNHASSLDIPLIEEVIGTYPHVWMSQHKFAKIPFFGFLLVRMHVLIDRNDARVAAHALIKACNIAKHTITHILLFPEGIRTRDGSLGPFKKGFTLIVKRLKCPVIPIAIKGSYEVMPPGSWVIRPNKSKIELIIGPHFYKEESESNDDFSNRIHAWFIEKLKK